MRFVRWKGEQPFRMRVLDPWLIIFVIGLFALAPILERRGLPEWVTTIGLVAIVLAGIFSTIRWFQRGYPRESPSQQSPRRLVSREEIKVSVHLTIVYGGIVLLIFTFLMWMMGTATLLGTGFATMASVLGVFIYLYAGRWPGKVTRSASIELDAVPDRVWDAITYRDDYPGWKKIYAGMERLDEPGEVFRIYHAEESKCGKCRLPRPPDRSRWSLRVEILEARRPCVYRMRSFAEGVMSYRGDAASLFDTEEMTYRLEPAAGGGTYLHAVSIVRRPKISLAISLLLGDPIGEHLGSLKAHLEGMPDESLFGIAAKRMEAARAAPSHCRCPEGPGPDIPSLF
jgi:hypothetical protein